MTPPLPSDSFTLVRYITLTILCLTLAACVPSDASCPFPDRGQATVSVGHMELALSNISVCTKGRYTAAVTFHHPQFGALIGHGRGAGSALDVDLMNLQSPEAVAKRLHGWLSIEGLSTVQPRLRGEVDAGIVDITRYAVKLHDVNLRLDNDTLKAKGRLDKEALFTWQYDASGHRLALLENGQATQLEILPSGK